MKNFLFILWSFDIAGASEKISFERTSLGREIKRQQNESWGFYELPIKALHT